MERRRKEEVEVESVPLLINRKGKKFPETATSNMTYGDCFECI
jgi:hypothetical protein